MSATTNVNMSQPKIGFSGFFTHVQDAPWYRLFLMPVIDELENLPAASKVLDVGTGPGKFIELAQSRLPHYLVGVDVDQAMLYQARQRPGLANVPLYKTELSRPLPFNNSDFDAVCICSVLFNLANPYPLLDESLRVLKPGGKIIILTPTGQGSFKQEIQMLLNLNFSIRNWTFLLWRNMTRFSGRQWLEKNCLKEVANKNNLDYTRRTVFEGFALIETLKK